MKPQILTLFWLKNDRLQTAFAALLFVVVALSLVVFLRTETFILNMVLMIGLTASIISGVLAQQRLPLVLVSILLLTHTGIFLLFTSDLTALVTSLLTAVTVAALVGVAESRRLSPFYLLIIFGLTWASFILTTALPSSLIAVTAIAALPNLVLLPLLLDERNPKMQLLHATLTGIVGGGIITATATLFI